MSISLTDVFVPAPDVVFRELEGESVLLNLATGIYFGLNATGTRMWQLIETHRTLAPVVVELAREFDAPPPQLEADLLELVAQLESKRLLTRGSAR